MSTVVTPLYGHVSPETAYLVEDYPYGRTLRCQIRYWLEYKPGKGFRLASQTTNPKAGHHWNKPKYSTYVSFAACMYLDEKGHCTWRGVGVYDDAEQVARFVRLFPDVPHVQLRFWAGKKAEHYDGLATGRIYMTLNGQRCEQSADETERCKREAAAWLAIVQELETRAP